MKLTILAGLPGSGKSTLAAKICENDSNTVCISADSIRAEIYGSEAVQTSPKKIFAIANNRMAEALRSGKSVVFDATSIKKRDRREALNAIPRECNPEVEFVVMNTPIDTCISRNNNRERVVPEDVIRRMSKKYELPEESEYPGAKVIYVI